MLYEMQVLATSKQTDVQAGVEPMPEARMTVARLYPSTSVSASGHPQRKEGSSHDRVENTDRCFKIVRKIGDMKAHGTAIAADGNYVSTSEGSWVWGPSASWASRSVIRRCAKEASGFRLWALAIGVLCFFLHSYCVFDVSSPGVLYGPRPHLILLLPCSGPDLSHQLTPKPPKWKHSKASLRARDAEGTWFRSAWAGNARLA